ncbi:MFS transporter [Arthrobacter sp. JZ12]|uniref:MFS transporter n=1 Tax=Arthrobacter sp. JZ12 TaxID=2654190 RepID=UPI002B4A4D66|nr:MFS transporter [Arthrobacter sp. JZ12]WRH25897.1 MFS transporter [Arthrobacter sp. JZ12]
MAPPPPSAPAGDPTLTAPIPVIAQRPAWRDTFISLRIPNFRRFAVSHLIAVVAMWMQRIAQDWMVLELSGSVTAVGVTVALQFAPMLLLGPWGGVVTDRYSKRTLLIITQSVAGAMAASMAVLVLTGLVQVWHVYVIAFVLGLATVVDAPARQVFVNDLVGGTYLRNAISLNSSIFQFGAMVGPAVSGALIVAVGGGWAFAMNAVACSYTVLTLCRLRTDQLNSVAPAPRARGQLREGARYLIRKPTILWSTVSAGFVAVFALSTPVLMAAYADDVFESGPGGYGLLNTSLAAGSLVGALASTRRGALRLRGVLGGMSAFGGFMVIAAYVPDQFLFSVLMFCAGIGSLWFITGANQLVQVSTNLAIRGRVMSLYMMVLIGGQALGGPMIGWFAEYLGAQLAMVIAGGVPVLAAGAIALLLARRGKKSV